MKIRTGFVSNSSTSSFVVITTKENHERVLKDMHPFHQEIIKTLTKEINFLEKDMLYSMELSDAGGYSHLFGEESPAQEIIDNYEGELPEDWDEEEGLYNASELHDSYIEKLKENPKEVFVASAYI